MGSASAMGDEEEVSWPRPMGTRRLTVSVRCRALTGQLTGFRCR